MRHLPIRPRLRRSLVAGAALTGLAAVGLAAGVSGLASAATPAPAAGSSSAYHFTTLGDHRDRTFNQLLGINDQGQIAGYFGAGTSATVHPNRGYVINPPYHQADFVNENFPGAAQTQQIGLNNSGTTVGFYTGFGSQADNFGFVHRAGVWTAVVDPDTTGSVNQLLGLNNYGQAVGFYTDTQGNDHAYRFDFHNDTFSAINVPGATSATATGINARGDVDGFYVNSAGDTLAFLETASGKVLSFDAPASTNTTAFGLNNSDQIVGSYTTGSGSNTVMHGFVWSGGTLRTVDDPNGIGTTTINGINDAGDIVGFYVQGTNTDGFVADPA